MVISRITSNTCQELCKRVTNFTWIAGLSEPWMISVLITPDLVKGLPWLMFFPFSSFQLTKSDNAGETSETPTARLLRNNLIMHRRECTKSQSVYTGQGGDNEDRMNEHNT